MRTAEKTAAFTLVELLVVISIIAVLAGLLMPAIMAAMNKAHQASTLNLIHQCELAAQSFFNDYGDYPPSHWSELDNVFDTFPENLFVGDEDADAAGDYEGAPVEDHDLYIDDGLDDKRGPTTINEGIEVFFACVATRNRGPYLEASADQIASTDRVTDAAGDLIDDLDIDRDETNNLNPPGHEEDPVDPIPDVREATNWYVGGNELFEIVDWWGNPLVYVHNRDYAAHDGVLAEAAGGEPIYEDAFDPPLASEERLVYVDLEGNVQYCYARSRYHSKTLTHPNLNSFQLYSWGGDLMPGRATSLVKKREVQYPGWTAASGTGADDWVESDSGGPSDPLVDDWNWVPGDGNLCNWEE